MRCGRIGDMEGGKLLSAKVKSVDTILAQSCPERG
jgi:hypothetical protein